MRLRRDEELEEEAEAACVEPVAEPSQPLGLSPVQLGVAARVVADEHLRVGRVEGGDVLAEVVAVLEVELVLAALLDGHRELSAERGRGPRDVRPELLVDEDPGAGERQPVGERLPEAVEDDALGLRDARSTSLGVGSPAIPRSFFWNEPRWSNARR